MEQVGVAVTLYVDWYSGRTLFSFWLNTVCSHWDIFVRSLHVNIRIVRHTINASFQIPCNSLIILPSDGIQSRSHTEQVANWRMNKKFWEELLSYIPLLRHEPHRKRRLQQFFVGVGTSLPGCLTTKGGTHVGTHRLTGGMCKVRRWDGLRCHVMHTEFHKDWFRHSKFVRRIHRQHGDLISLFSFISK
jgi:hypothetical protein